MRVVNQNWTSADKGKGVEIGKLVWNSFMNSHSSKIDCLLPSQESMVWEINSF